MPELFLNYFCLVEAETEKRVPIFLMQIFESNSAFDDSKSKSVHLNWVLLSLFLTSIKDSRKGCATIAPGIRLRLPSCCPGFESQAGHLCFYHLPKTKFVLYLSCEKNENRQKEAGFDPFLRLWNEVIKGTFDTYYEPNH